MKLGLLRRRSSEIETSSEQLSKLPPGFKLRIALTRAKGEDYEGVERESYPPDGFAKVTIVEGREGYKYVIEDPKVSEETLYKAQRLIDEVLLYIVRPEDVEGGLTKIFDALGIKGDDYETRALRYLIQREVVGYKVVHPLVMDDNLEGIACDSPDRPVVVTHRKYGRMPTNIYLTKEQLDEMVRLLAYRGGRSISRFRPQVNVVLPTGDRAALTLGEGEVARSSSFVIRKFPKRPWTPPLYIATGVISPEAMALLWLASEHKLALMSFGGLGTGKTTLINAVAMLLPPEARIGIACDIPEMDIPHPGKVLMYERAGYGISSEGAITMMDLVKHLLRYDCDYITINEIRGEEAKVFGQALGIGQGGLASIHTESPEALFGRLKDLGVEKALAAELRVLAHMGLFQTKTQRMRRVKAIYFVEGLDEEYRPKYMTIARYVIEKDRVVVEDPRPVFKLIAERSLKNEAEIEASWRLRAKFLRLVTATPKVRERLSEPGEWLKVLTEFYRNPKSLLARLEEVVKAEQLFVSLPAPSAPATAPQVAPSPEGSGEVLP
jgi:flagellar protein FlaI